MIAEIVDHDGKELKPLYNHRGHREHREEQKATFMIFLHIFVSVSSALPVVQVIASLFQILQYSVGWLSICLDCLA